jgi:hypothetical protein
MPKEMVEIELFKDSKDYKDDVFVCVNGKDMVIKRGVKVKVSKAYAEVLEHSKVQDTATAKMIEDKADEFSAETRARNL